MKQIKQFAAMVLFWLSTSLVLMFFSEKSYWYVQGFRFLGLWLAYAIPTFWFLWVFRYFEV